jgi:hypothetical protein
MSEHDSDIEFDFFDEPETGESPASAGRSRSQPPDGAPKRSGPGGIPPTARLAALIAFGILIVVLLVLWVQSCSGTSKKSSYEHYLDKVAPLAQDSNRAGTALATAIATPGIKAGELATKMDQLAQQQQVDEQTATKIKPPSNLESPHRYLVSALQLRTDGLTGLARELRAGAGSTKVSETAANLAAVTQYLVASDVLWDVRFREPTRLAIQQDGITGLTVPASRFLREQGVDSSAFWAPVVDRLNGNTTSGGNTSGKAVGTQLVSTKALPNGPVLNESSLNTVNEGTNLGFAVTVKNSGDVQVASVQVTITIKQKKPITATKTIPLINPGNSTTVKFTLPQADFVTRTTVQVDVQPVPGETNPRNNSASYPVIFSLG